jgi:internalin A
MCGILLAKARKYLSALKGSYFMGKVIFENGDYGVKAILTAPWESSFLKLLLNKNVKELELNDGHGWKGSDVDFLEFLPQLNSLIIINFKVKSVKAVHHLKELYNLRILTYCDTPIDFSVFTKLISCGLEWRKGAESLFNAVNLKHLSVNSYKQKNSSVFSKLVNLEELIIMNSNLEDLSGLSPLTNLKYLRLTNLNRIKTLDGIGNLNQLQILMIQRCMGINAIEEIFSLHHLKRLIITDMTKIKTIHGIEALSDLEMFNFYGSTNIQDGDLTPILKLKKLKAISY